MPPLHSHESMPMLARSEGSDLLVKHLATAFYNLAHTMHAVDSRLTSDAYGYYVNISQHIEDIDDVDLTDLRFLQTACIALDLYVVPHRHKEFVDYLKDLIFAAFPSEKRPDAPDNCLDVYHELHAPSSPPVVGDVGRTLRALDLPLSRRVSFDRTV